MAMRSKALPLTPSCPSSLPDFASQTGHARKLPLTEVRWWFLPGTPVSFISNNYSPLYGKKGDERNMGNVYYLLWTRFS